MGNPVRKIAAGALGQGGCTVLGGTGGCVRHVKGRRELPWQRKRSPEAEADAQGLAGRGTRCPKRLEEPGRCRLEQRRAVSRD